jgi:polyhydroxybutyrate depolymerase
MAFACFNRSSGTAALTRLITVGAFFLGAGSAFADCGQPLQPGRHDFSVQSSDATRSGVYFVPSSYTGEKKVPVVFDFHGSHSHPEGQLKRSSWDKVAEREGFIVVALQGSLPGSFDGTYAWNVPLVTNEKGGLNEIAFIKSAVQAIEDKACLDRSRIYASGYSGGGRMLSQFICGGNDEFAAAGFVHSLRAGAPVQVDGQWKPDTVACAPKRPMSIIAFAGEKDGANPYAGGGKAYWQYGFKTAVQRWSELDGCTGDATTEKAGDVTRRLYDTCKAGARIATYVYANGGHSWPKAGDATRDVMAAANGSATGVVKVAAVQKASFNPDVDPAQRMWEFFQKADKSDLVATAAPVAAKAGEVCAATINGASDSADLQGATCSSQQINARRSGQGAKGAL